MCVCVDMYISILQYHIILSTGASKKQFAAISYFVLTSDDFRISCNESHLILSGKLLGELESQPVLEPLNKACCNGHLKQQHTVEVWEDGRKKKEKQVWASRR